MKTGAVTPFCFPSAPSARGRFFTSCHTVDAALVSSFIHLIDAPTDITKRRLYILFHQKEKLTALLLVGREYLQPGTIADAIAPLLETLCYSRSELGSEWSFGLCQFKTFLCRVVHNEKYFVQNKNDFWQFHSVPNKYEHGPG